MDSSIEEKVVNPALEFTEARNRFYNAKISYAAAQREFANAKVTFQRTMEVMKKTLQRDIQLMEDEEPLTVSESLLHTTEKKDDDVERVIEQAKPVKECPLKLAGEIIEKEKKHHPRGSLNEDELKLWKTKIHPWIKKQDPAEVASKIGSHPTTVYAWLYNGTAPSKHNFDQIVALKDAGVSLVKTVSHTTVSQYERTSIYEKQFWKNKMFPVLKKMDLTQVAKETKIPLTTLAPYFSRGTFPNKVNFDVLFKFLEKN